MSIDVAHLALLLDAPLHSWGFESRFQRRTTVLHPTKSGVIGLICAAMGLPKGSEAERDLLPKLASLAMTIVAIPRRRVDKWTGEAEKLPMLRLNDFHTVGGGYSKETERQSIPRKASKGPCDNPTVTRREYLMDACFGVILSGDRAIVERAHEALLDPVWGVWFGRKSCIPSAPIAHGVFPTEAEACRTLIGDLPRESLFQVSDAESFAAGTDTLNDRPLSFGDGKSSGSDARRFAPRRINVQPGTREG